MATNAAMNSITRRAKPRANARPLEGDASCGVAVLGSPGLMLVANLSPGLSDLGEMRRT